MATKTYHGHTAEYYFKKYQEYRMGAIFSKDKADFESQYIYTNPDSAELVRYHKALAKKYREEAKKYKEILKVHFEGWGL